MPVAVRLKGRDLRPHKAASKPMLGARTVLTNSPWDFVALWLKREKKKTALFYWDQARSFADAAVGMPIESAPLLHYYAFMNEVKALLSAKGVTFNEHHGVRYHNMGGGAAPPSKVTLANEGVEILTNNGIAPALSAYLSEAEAGRTHSLEELLFNIPWIHRTFCLTYTSQTDLFIPLTNCRYLCDDGTKTAYFAAELSKDFASKTYAKRLPPALIVDPAGLPRIRSALTVPLSKAAVTKAADLAHLATLHLNIRKDIHYINGAETLWYAKGIVAGPRRLQRFPLTITLMAMHRLSELCRYRPLKLASLLAGQKNWLLSEFIQMSPAQFLDEIAAELTGYQFMIPNVRPAR